MEGVVVVECCFDSYDEFITEYQTYRFDECANCNGCCELVETELTCIIEGRILHFSPILYYVVKNAEMNSCLNIRNR